MDSPTQEGLLKRFINSKPALTSGGSVANTIATFAMLGHKAGFMSSLGDDAYGRHFCSELNDLKIDFPCRLGAGGMTATAVVLVTPDGERTMRFGLGEGG